MIPKKIHYCWFGNGEKPKLVKKCIESWKKYCPDFEIIEWNENNYNVYSTPYTKYCYVNKKWAFLSDYVRLDVIAQYGGVYFDTDVEVVRDFEKLLEFEAFYGFEDDENVNTGQGFGACKMSPTVLAMKQKYDVLKPSKNGDYPYIKCPQMNTEALLDFEIILNGQIQVLGNAIVLSSDYMNPYDDATGKLHKTDNTFSIHWYSKSWMDKRIVLRSKLSKPLHRLQTIIRGKEK